MIFKAAFGMILFIAKAKQFSKREKSGKNR
jgi:hypothetical protein